MKTPGFYDGVHLHICSICLRLHCVKSVQIRSFFWSIFSLSTGKYGPEKTPYFDAFHAVFIVSSLTEIQYLQIEPGRKGAHTNESMMLKIFYLYGFLRITKCVSWALENKYLLVYKLLSVQLNEILQ